jgi:hypothetical protein
MAEVSVMLSVLELRKKSMTAVVRLWVRRHAVEEDNCLVGSCLADNCLELEVEEGSCLAVEAVDKELQVAADNTAEDMDSSD